MEGEHVTSTQRGINTLPIKETKDLLLYAVLKIPRTEPRDGFGDYLKSTNVRPP
ncbi:hypothetical protein P5673_021177 [Acropora cervicornis]|uniref:Uncharacterized protein n=1 Tax=Acropora cervicornis TaxID=6130 RepID=A0AAD9Q8P3_ACRCE|nr:hypothetical protein P5673_021177 [Acropora cervicornis]